MVRCGSTDRVIDFRFAPPTSWTLICRPDDPHKSLVREDGALLYGFRAASFDAWHFDTVLEFSAQTAQQPTHIEQHTETPRRGIVCTTVRYPHQTLELRSFGHDDDGRRSDVVLWSLTAHPDVDEVLAGLHIDAHLRGHTLAASTEGPCHQVYRVPADPAPATPAWTDGIPRISELADEDSACVLRSTPHALLGVHSRGFRPASGLVTTPVILRGGESVHGALVLPLGHEETDHIDQQWAENALTATRRFWDDEELLPLPLHVPDSEVQSMLTACSRTMLQTRELVDGAPILHVGPTIYRGLWLVDGHFLAEAARYAGFADTADAALHVLLQRVREDGSIIEIDEVPHLKETGVAITTLVRQCELTGDAAMLQRNWHVIRAAVKHIGQLRSEASRLPRDHPFHGLMPEAFGDGGIAGCRAEYTTTLWTLIGLKAAHRGAQLIGAVHDAQEFHNAYTGLKQDFEISAAGHRRPLPSGEGHFLPMCPPGSGSHQFRPHVPDEQVPRWRQIQPETATWALCHAIWPGEVFSPNENYVTDVLALFDSRDDAEGIPATTGWLPYRSVWTYAGSLAAHAWLYAGRSDKAVDYLYAFANHAAPTRVWREEQSLRGTGHGQVCGDMPHSWASAEFIRLVRHLLVFEHGEDLLLLPGLPDEWTRPGANIRIAETPTRFGRVSLTVDVDPQFLRIRVTRHAANQYPPRKCRLLAPPAYRRRVAINGNPQVLDAAGYIELPLLEDTATVEAQR